MQSLVKNGVVSNSAFIVNENDVVVVDAQLRPSWAREVISEIKKVTDKPVDTSSTHTGTATMSRAIRHILRHSDQG